jgi:hypothetical protein
VGEREGDEGMKWIKERREGEEGVKLIRERKERYKGIRLERIDFLLETKPVSKPKCDDQMTDMQRLFCLSKFI